MNQTWRLWAVTLLAACAHPAPAPSAAAPEVAVPPAASDALIAQAADTKKPVEARTRALEALANVAAPGRVAALKPLLDDAAPAVRKGAAHVLGRAGGPDAKAALEERLDREDDPSVRDQLQRALTQVEP